MNELQQYFEHNQGLMIDKWQHYFAIYDQYFKKYRGTDVVFVEIGVFQGGSLQMWKQYFGNKAKIYGVDINPACKRFEDEQITILIGDQQDKQFLQQLKNTIPKIDILLDDGGHTMKQQINTFEVLFDHINDEGVFLCEDTHTSYWWQYGGGYRRKGSFIEYAKNLVDSLYGFHTDNRHLSVTKMTQSLKAIHFYDSIVVMEKAVITPPIRQRTGIATLPPFVLKQEIVTAKLTHRFKDLKNRWYGKFFG